MVQELLVVVANMLVEEVVGAVEMAVEMAVRDVLPLVILICLGALEQTVKMVAGHLEELYQVHLEAVIVTAAMLVQTAIQAVQPVSLGR